MSELGGVVCIAIMGFVGAACCAGMAVDDRRRCEWLLARGDTACAVALGLIGVAAVIAAWAKTGVAA